MQKFYTIILILILTIATLIRIYKVANYMSFIGDQGWFYISARNILINHQFPLVGITSSHLWLHQGAIWTYILALGLLIDHFDPLAGEYIAMSASIITAYLLYKVGNEFINQRVGVIAAFLYLFSPLVISFDRMPYHTTLIPLCMTAFLYCLFQWMEGNIKYFPWIFFFIGLLYNFEIATSVTWMIVVLLLVIGYKLKAPWFSDINYRHIFSAFVLWFIPMSLMIVYDMQNGYPETLGFFVWSVYKLFKLLTFQGSSSLLSSTIFLLQTYQQMILPKFPLIVDAIGLGSLSLLFYQHYLKKTSRFISVSFLSLLILSFGFIAIGTMSQAYLPMFIPIVLLLQSYILSQLFVGKIGKSVITSLLIFFFASNLSLAFIPNLSSYEDRLNIAKQIVQQAGIKQYNIIVLGKISEYPSSIMNYEYLTWLLGHPPSPKQQELRFTVAEKDHLILKKVSMLQ